MTLTKSETTRARILEAARGLFIAQTYASVTTAQIAAMAEVTKGGLYHHFSSKEELYLAFLHEDLATKKVLFRQAVELEGHVRERLAQLTRSFLELAPALRMTARLVRRDINVFSEEDQEKLVRHYQAALPQQVETILHDGMADGTLAPTDSRLLSWHFVALVEVTLTPYANSVFENNDSKLDLVLNLFLGGASATTGDTTS
ncbi:MAG: TetR/AcrR family transcriptional regulator [Planctomycetes bacterium]|nr:TetR/AcrR family transcriptional regulator [Planctomycetota bacterium]